MNLTRTSRGILAFTAATLLWGWGTASAEVGASTIDPRHVSTLLMDRVNRITDGADPIPQIRWNPYRRIRPVLLLNVSGAVRHDGRPDVAFLPGAGWPFVTWAYNNGQDHDIAFSFWNFDHWTDTEFLTFHTDDEVDPRVFVSPNQSINVVWAIEGIDSRIMLSSRRLDVTGWTTPRRLTPPNEHVARPSIASTEGVVWLAYERFRSVDGVAHPTVVAKRVDSSDTGLAVREFPSSRNGELDPVLHVNGGRVWMDWKFSDDQFAWVILEGPGDREVHLTPWTDGSWVGTESARLAIQRIIMGFQPEFDANTNQQTNP